MNAVSNNHCRHLLRGAKGYRNLFFFDGSNASVGKSLQSSCPKILDDKGRAIEEAEIFHG